MLVITYQGTIILLLFLGRGWTKSRGRLLLPQNGPIVLVSDDRWVWSISAMIIGKGKLKFSDNKTCPSGTLSTRNPTWVPLGLNPEIREWINKPVSNNLNTRLADKTNGSHLNDLNLFLLLTNSGCLPLNSLLSALITWRLCVILLKCSDTGVVYIRALISCVLTIWRRKLCTIILVYFSLYVIG
jgi:hypothetical protein